MLSYTHSKSLICSTVRNCYSLKEVNVPKHNNILKISGVLLIILCSIPIFCLGMWFSDENITLTVIFLVWIGLLVINLSREKVMILAFLITFFMFLLGELLVNQFDDTTFHAASEKTIFHAHTCIYISLVFFGCGTYLDKWKFVLKNFDSQLIPFEFDLIHIQKSCRILYIIFGLCSLASALERLLLSYALGTYTATFVNFSSNLPGIIIKCAGMSDMVFFLFLATLPDPRKSKMVFGLKIITSLVLLIFGTRSTIVLTILIITIYCIYYENIEGKKYSIIPKGVYVIGLCLVPVVLILFDFIMANRDGRVYVNSGYIDSIKHIVTSVGGSINVITYGYEKNDDLPQKLYSLGGIINFFTQNIFARSIFGIEQYGGNTVEMALYGNSFSNALTYLVKKSSFLAGYGMGSSYIAEVFHDFGYVGVALINIIYGKILASSNKLESSKLVKNAIVLMASYNILIAPRAYADGFISCFLNFSFIMAVVFVFVLSSILREISK